MRTRRATNQSLTHRLVAAVLIGLLIGQPAVAQPGIVVDQSADAAERPELEAAANGVAVVRIAPPNDAGLSHNRYRRFDVGEDGAVLNNSTEEVERSQLGGLVLGNGRLKDSGAARVILNEVRSTARTELRGAVEVHGHAADVIVANPNGLTCAGCGFINTPRVTLAVGVAELGGDGSLAGLRMEGGDLVIGANGADMAGAAVFDLLARSIDIRGAMQAGGTVNAIAGSTTYGYADGRITPLADGEEAPGLAIDSTLLGGMYGKRIRIVSTDEGAGVRLRGPLAASTAGIELSADGRLELSEAQAATSIEARSGAAAVAVDGTAYAGESVELVGVSAVELGEGSYVGAGATIDLSAEMVSLGEGALVTAGVNADGEQGTGGVLRVTAQRLETGSGSLAAGERLEVRAATIDLSREAEAAALQSAGDLLLDTGTVTAANARVTALGGLTITAAGELRLTEGNYVAGMALDVSGQKIVTSAGLSAGGTVRLRAGGGGIVNSGRVWGDGGTTVSAAGAVSNSGSILSRAQVRVIAGGALTNTAAGTIAGDGGVTVRSGSLNNAGKLQGGPLRVEAAGGLTNLGTLASAATAHLRVDGPIVNSGNLLAQQALVLRGLSGDRAGALSNRPGGTINSAWGSYRVASLTNGGTLAAYRTTLDVDAAGGVQNTGTMSAKTEVTITAGGGLSSSGTVVSLGSAELRVDGSIVNSGDLLVEEALEVGGLSAAHGGALVNQAGGTINSAWGSYRVASLTNAGTLAAYRTTLDVDAAGDVETTGTMSAKTGLTVRAGGDLTTGGTVVSLDAAELRVDGSIVNSGDLLVEEALEVGGLNAARGGALSNRPGGTINSAWGSYRVASLTNAGTLAAYATTLDVDAAGGVQNTGTMSAKTEVTITAGGGLSSSGTVVSLGSAELRVDGSIVNSGDLLVEEALEVGGLSAARGGALVNQAGGTINSAWGSYRVASLTNAGTLAAYATTLDVDAAGDVQNSGTMSAATDLKIIAGGDLSNSGTMIAAGQMTLGGHDGGRLGVVRTTSADSVIDGKAGLTIRASSLANEGAIGSSDGTLSAELSGDLVNTGLLYSGTSSHYRLAGSFTNSEADVLAETDLTIEGLSGARAGALHNRSGRIEAIGGDLTLKAAAVTNERLRLEIQTETVTEGPTTAESMIAPCRDTSFGIGYDHCAGEHPQDANQTTDTVTTTVVTETTAATDVTEAGQLLAGRDLTIETGELRNRFSQIGAQRDVTIRADRSVSNEGEDLVATVTTTTVTVHDEWHCGPNHCHGFLGIGGGWHVGTTTDDPVTETVVTPLEQRIYGTIHAGRTLLIRVSGVSTDPDEIEGYEGEFKNEAIGGNRVPSYAPSDREPADRDAEGRVDGGTGAEAPEADAEDRVDGGSGAGPPSYAAVPMGNLLISIEGLLGRKALFRERLEPDMPYLIQTRSQFIDLSEFLGSDYFLSRVNVPDGEVILKRLGDAYVETRLIERQMFMLTGRRTLVSGLDYRSQMRALYDGAVAAYESLQLTVGVALSAQQVAALTGDIIWLERHTVRGQEVLVPRLYLSRATRARLDLSSAQVSGERTIIDAGTVVNAGGSIVGRGALAIRTVSDLLNERGILTSGGDLGIQAGGLFSNLAGTVRGEGDVGIAAGAILNQTLASRQELGDGFAERAGETATIEAGGTLSLSAAGSIYSIGGDLRSGEAMALQAGDDIRILALALAEGRASQSVLDLVEADPETGEYDLAALERALARLKEQGGDFEYRASLTHQLAGVEAGGELVVSAGGDLTVRGAEVSAGGDATLFAAGDTTIESVQEWHRDEAQSDTRSEGPFGLFSTGSATHELDTATETRRTTIDAGGELTIGSTDGDVVLDAVSLASGDEVITLSAQQGTVSLLANTDQSSEREYARDEGLLWYTETDRGQTQTTVEHVEIAAGTTVNIAATDVVVEHQVQAGQSFEELVQRPELAWMQPLREDDRVEWTEVEAAFEEWDYESQGLTATGAVLVSLVVGVATGGALSGAAATITQGLGLAGNAAVQAAVQAGLNTLVQQAAVNLVNNQGDIAATLAQLASGETLRSLGAAMLTAGLTTGLTEAAGLGAELLPGAPLAERVGQDIGQGLIAAGVDTGVSTIVEGQELGEALLGSLRTEAAGVLGENVAQEIGAAVANGDLDTAGQLIAHGALGCATGVIAAGDCASGAAGAVIGEATALIYQSQIEGWLEDAEAGTLSIDEIADQVEAMKKAGVDVAKLASGFAVGMAGGNVDVAAEAGANAAENNVFWMVPIIIVTLEVVDKALLAYDAAQLVDAAIDGDDERAAELATDLSISIWLEMTAGTLVPGSVVATKILQRVSKILRKRGLGRVADAMSHLAPGTTAYHHTATESVESILRQGLRPGSYGTPTGNLSPLQAKIELALPGNAPKNAVVEIDLEGLRKAGYDLPEVTRVTSQHGFPGGGYEMRFKYEIPPEFLRIVPR